MIPKYVFSMKRLYDTYTIYEFSDECIVKEICKRVKSIRLSCCFSQQEFADKAGVSIITIKRIESCKVSDIALSTLLKILRMSGTLEGVVGLVPELPDSPFLINEKQVKEYTELTVNVRWYEERADYSECISVGDLHWQIELGL